MGFRFRKSIKLLPGVRLNLSKSGLSASVGKPGATINLSQRGTRTTVGVPGTGHSYSDTRKAPADPQQAQAGIQQAQLEVFTQKKSLFGRQQRCLGLVNTANAQQAADFILHAGAPLAANVSQALLVEPAQRRGLWWS